MTEPSPLDAAALPHGLRARYVPDINGLRIHLIEAGFATPNRPCILLLHGFPELAYSWRKLMPLLADAGYHVIAPDLRGYGRTTGWDTGDDHGLPSFRLLNAVRDAVGLVAALGYRSVAAVVGHDFGSPVAAWCALVRPDVFRSVALMSAPFAGPPALLPGLPQTGTNTATNAGTTTGTGATTGARSSTQATAAIANAGAGGMPLAAPAADIHRDLARLERPRKHYQWYYSTPEANADMWQCPQGVHDFLRAYYHHKSADWQQNRPFKLRGWIAEELAKMPTYYIMDLHEDMPATVAHEMPTPAEIAACRWLPDDELRVYSGEYQRTGFQGGLNWYRRGTGGLDTAELQLFAGRGIDVPATFIAGTSDWGVYQNPGALERMQTSACSRFVGCHLIDGAGHWVQQEQPEQVADLLLRFVRQSATDTA